MALVSPALGSGSATGTQVGVPNVVGRTQGEAETILSGFGLKSRAENIEADFEEGKVFAQNPEANSVRPKNTVVTLLIAKAPVVPVNLGELLEELKAAVDPIAPAVQAVGTQVTTLDEKVGSTVTKLDDLTTKVDTATGKLDDLTAKVDTATGKLDGLDTKVDGVRTKVDDIATSVGAVATKVDGLDGKVETVSGTVDGLVTKIDSIATAVAAAETDTAAEDRMQKILDKLDEGQVARGNGGSGGGAAKRSAGSRRSGDPG
ncbi:PASTA domain-containing protein [Kribbella sp. NPDC003557]|uniref:PASTA domain-containing protein n=1 Tax=Kribbella sp. NPDC003557 TaxID=3154449 RepID=UPI0033A713B7